jgi:hypothetical protein
VDLSAPLTAALRARSALEGNPAAWERLVRRLEPPGLAAAGFVPCAPAPDRGGQHCLCRAAG